MTEKIEKIYTTLSNLPDVPLRIIFSFLSKLDHAHLQEVGDSRLKEVSVQYVGEGIHIIQRHLAKG